MAKGVLIEIDKQWIVDLITTSITTAIRPHQVDIQVLKDDMKNVKHNISEINQRLDKIENCPTIKKELKK